MSRTDLTLQHLEDQRNREVTEHQESLVCKRSSLAKIYSSIYRGVISSSDILDFLEELAEDISMTYDPNLDCKITTIYHSWAKWRIPDLLKKLGCGKCPKCKGTGKINGDSCMLCNRGYVQLFCPASELERPESEKFVTMAEWLAEFLTNDDFSEEFTELQSMEFRQFADDYKDALSPESRIIVAPTFLARNFNEDDRMKLDRLSVKLLKKPMTDNAIRVAKHRAINLFQSKLKMWINMDQSGQLVATGNVQC